MRQRIGAAVVFAAAVGLGCGDDGPKRYRLSGEVKYDGQPIPFGDVLFTPDGSKKNSGPQGFATIRDGKFDTGAAEGKGIGGGPMVLRVTGFSGPGGKLLCEVEIPADLPAQDSTYNIEVPKKDDPARKKGAEI